MADPQKWLQSELPKWVDDGLVSSEQADRISARYDGARTDDRSMNLVVVLFGIIGSLLIGGGLILIVAHNWTEMPRPVRAVIAFIPLLVTQALGLHTLRRRNDAASWREPVAIGWTLMIGLAIALVAQTYHMPGAFDTFSLTWMLLALPVVYLLRSVSALLIYLAGIVSWGFASEFTRGHCAEFWLLLAAVVPLVYRWHRDDALAARPVLSRWALIAVMITALMGFVEYHSGVPWLITNSLFAAALFSYGVLAEKDAPTSWQQPCIVVGTVALGILAYMLTWHWFWEEMGGGFQIRPGGKQPWIYIAALSAVAAGYGITFARIVALRYPVAITWAALPLIYMAGLLIVRSDAIAVAMIILTNVYVLGAGVMTLSSGIRLHSLTRVNVGMLVIASLIVSRFFDAEFSIIIRAVVFIALGLAFLLVNLRLARRKAGRAGA